MESARLATPDDVPALARLAAEAVAEQRDARGGRLFAARETRPLPADESLAEAVADPDQLVLVGLIDDVPVGYAVVRTEALRDGSVLGIISDLFVEPRAREVGVGEELIERALAWCRERGCAGVDGLALPGNRETKNFFESFGFTARAIVVHRPFEPSGP